MKGGLANAAAAAAIVGVARVLIYLDQPTIGALPGFLPVAVRTVIFALLTIVTIISFRSHTTINT